MMTNYDVKRMTFSYYQRFIESRNYDREAHRRDGLRYLRPNANNIAAAAGLPLDWNAPTESRTAASVLNMARVKVMNDVSIKAFAAVIQHNRDEVEQDAHCRTLELFARLLDALTADGPGVTFKRESTIKVPGKDGKREEEQNVRQAVTIRSIHELRNGELYQIIFRALKRDMLRALAAYGSVSAPAAAEDMAVSDEYRAAWDEDAAAPTRHTDARHVSVNTVPMAADDLLDRIEARHRTLTGYGTGETSIIEALDAIRGTLSAAEYRYLIQWADKGVQPYRSSNTPGKIKAKLRRMTETGLMTLDEAAAAIEEAARAERHRAASIARKLDALNII